MKQIYFITGSGVMETFLILIIILIIGGIILWAIIQAMFALSWRNAFPSVSDLNSAPISIDKVMTEAEYNEIYDNILRRYGLQEVLKEHDEGN